MEDEGVLLDVIAHGRKSDASAMRKMASKEDLEMGMIPICLDKQLRHSKLGAEAEESL